MVLPSEPSFLQVQGATAGLVLFGGGAGWDGCTGLITPSPKPRGSCCHGDTLVGSVRWGWAGGSDKAMLLRWGRVGWRWREEEPRCLMGASSWEVLSTTWACLPPPPSLPFPSIPPSLPAAACPFGPFIGGCWVRGSACACVCVDTGVYGAARRSGLEEERVGVDLGGN